MGRRETARASAVWGRVIRESSFGNVPIHRLFLALLYGGFSLFQDRRMPGRDGTASAFRQRSSHNRSIAVSFSSVVISSSGNANPMVQPSVKMIQSPDYNIYLLGT